MDIKSALLSGAIQLTSLEVGEGPDLNKLATTYDGTTHSVSRFYKSENTNVALGGHVTTPEARYHFKVDTGHYTAKYDKDPTIGLGYQNNDWLIYAEVGGDESHSPCLDDYNRQYYCQSLTAWSDSKPNEDDDNRIYIKRTFRF